MERKRTRESELYDAGLLLAKNVSAAVIFMNKSAKHYKDDERRLLSRHEMEGWRSDTNFYESLVYYDLCKEKQIRKTYGRRKNRATVW